MNPVPAKVAKLYFATLATVMHSVQEAILKLLRYCYCTKPIPIFVTVQTGLKSSELSS